MSRFVKRSAENEPLMRLERPTLASSQTTAHIINSCFHEALSQRQQMDSGAINNMAVSRRGDPNLYHDSLVKEAKQISDAYKRRIDDLLAVERHLLQAKAKALAEDERHLTNSTPLTTINQQEHEQGVVLPNGPSQFRKQLNEELLARHCLLSPSQYLPQPLAPREAPKEGPPSYLQSTYTWTQHALVPDAMDNQSSFASRKKKQSLKPIWRESLPQEEREAEKSRLTKLERKAGYLKNPKCSQSALTNTASSGPLKLKLQQQTDQDSVSKDVLQQLFVAEPAELVFTDYQINQTYEATVVLKNVSGASRQLRVIPLNSPFFKVQTGYFPGSEGLIAPGMHCSYVIKFTPDSLANYEEQLMIQCNNGEILTIPLRAYRPPPDLSLPQELDCGHCLAGHTKTVVMKCDNFGGEGNFKLFPIDTPPDQECQDQSPQRLHLGPFSLSPTEFSLPRGSSVEFTAVFSPSAVGCYTEQFTMACDNGQILTFTLKGGADVISIAPVYTGHSSPYEIKTYHTLTNSNGVALGGKFPDDLLDTLSGDEVTTSHEALEWSRLEFTPTYPCKPSYTTITLHNFSGVNLPFSWQFYRPVGVPLLPSSPDHEDVPIVKQLIPTTERLFTVQPSTGTLQAGQSKNFICQFLPQKSGQFVDVAHLVLSGIDGDLSLDPSKAGGGAGWIRLSLDQVSIAHMELNGTSEPYSIELNPSSVVLDEEIPTAIQVRKPFQVTNKSLTDVSYQWDCCEVEGLSVSVEPTSGHFGYSECVTSEVVIQAERVGPFSTTLHCHLEQSTQSLSMLVQGHVQAPVVRVSVDNLDFGLIQLGRCVSLQFQVINESHCPVMFQLQQLVKQKKVFKDHSCLSFSIEEGELAPLSRVSVTVECKPCDTGRLRSIVQLLVNKEPSRHIAVIADVQRPKVSLETSQFHFEDAYVDTEKQLSTKLINTGLLPCYYSWSSQVFGDGSEYCNVDIQPMTGRVDPGQCITVAVSVTWNKVGSHEARLKCDVINVEEPLFLSLASQVHGLAVTYKVTGPGETRDGTTVSSECVSETLDYGDSNKLGEPVLLTVDISNPTAIPTFYEASVSHFPPAKPPTPPTQPMPSTSLLNSQRSRGRYLLNKTVNPADPKSKTQQQAAVDYASSLLCDGRGACFVVSPPSAALPPFSTTTIRVTAYSNMWGEYSDQLLCKITGLETKVLPIRFGVKGCPIVFQTTATAGYTLCRLGSHLPDAKTVTRVLKLKNTSPMGLRVDWRMMNIMQEDNKIVDLVTFIGEAFPKINFLTNSSSDIHKQTDHLHKTKSHLHTSFDDCDKKKEGAVESLDGGMENAECLTEWLIDGREPLIRALIKPHEGTYSHEPFDIHPRQMTLPPYGHGTVKVSFQPSIEVLNDLGDQLTSYAAGYISLDEESPANVKRLCGYDVEPLRVDIMAAIEHSKLTLECDEDSRLDFHCAASLLLDADNQLKEHAVVSHNMTLVNHGLSTVSIKLSTEEHHFNIDGVTPALRGGNEFTTLHPSDSIHFNVLFSFPREDVQQDMLTSDSSIREYSSKLCVEFSTGAKQVFPISASVSLPGLRVSSGQLNFGTRHLGSTTTLTLLLLNDNPVTALWSLELIDQELKNVLQVCSEGGLLPAHLIDGGPTSQLVQVTFTPSQETEYTGTLALYELITGGVAYIEVCGRGSADEQHLR